MVFVCLWFLFVILMSEFPMCCLIGFGALGQMRFSAWAATARVAVARWVRWNGLGDMVTIDSPDQKAVGPDQKAVGPDQQAAAVVPAVTAVLDTTASEIDRDIRRVIVAWRTTFLRARTLERGGSAGAAATAQV